MAAGQTTQPENMASSQSVAILRSNSGRTLTAKIKQKKGGEIHMASLRQDEYRTTVYAERTEVELAKAVAQARVFQSKIM